MRNDLILGCKDLSHSLTILQNFMNHKVNSYCSFMTPTIYKDVNIGVRQFRIKHFMLNYNAYILYQFISKDIEEEVKYKDLFNKFIDELYNVYFKIDVELYHNREQTYYELKIIGDNKISYIVVSNSNMHYKKGLITSTNKSKLTVRETYVKGIGRNKKEDFIVLQESVSKVLHKKSNKFKLTCEGDNILRYSTKSDIVQDIRDIIDTNYPYYHLLIFKYSAKKYWFEVYQDQYIIYIEVEPFNYII